MEWDKKWTIGE